MPITLIVEDGTGVPNANTLASVAFVDTYHLERFNDGWDGDAEAKASALVVATDYLRTRFQYKGVPTHPPEEQNLPFPRRDLEDDDGRCLDPFTVPLLVKEATAEFALAAITSKHELVTSRVGDGVTRRRERVGSIETDVEYLVSEASTTYPRALSKIARFVVSDLERGATSIQRG